MMDNNDADQPQETTVSLQQRILDCIETAPNHTLRPARLAAELGSLSVEDAAAELCSVMAAVGSTASFSFETPTAEGQQQPVMVFVFPSNFRRLALQHQRRQDWKARAAAAAQLGWKVLQIVTALGLLLSLLILSVVAVLAMVAALIALQRAGHDRQGTQRLMRQIQHVCLTVRQALWCYALLGPDLANDGEGGGREPFLRDMAYDMALVSSVCCGNPGSIFYWWRVHQLSSRRHRMARGWRREHNYEYQDSPDVEGVQLIRRGGRDDEAILDNNNSTPSQQQHRGLLSIAVEFLFGPPRSGDAQQVAAAKWKLRAAFLVRQSTVNGGGRGVSLTEMTPYADNPPASLCDTATVVTQGLLLVSHFHGVPVKSSSNNNDMAQARFVFPELVSESAVALRYDPPPVDHDTSSSPWTSVLYQSLESAAASHRAGSGKSRLDFPTYYHEPRLVFSTLTLPQFTSCAVLALLNLLGAWWFQQATDLGGILDTVAEFQGVARVLRHTLAPVLVFYAILFWTVALARLAWIVLWCNRRRRLRNERRRAMAAEEASAQ